MADDTTDQWLVSWQHEALGIPDIWRQDNFGKDITVAVLDTGMAAPPGLDNPAFEYCAADGRPIGPGDSNGHGTCCASSIANYRGGTMGIAPFAKLVSVRVLGTGSLRDVLSAFELIQRRDDIDVVSCSFIVPSMTPELMAAVRAVANSGKVVVCAAGDENTSSPFPEAIQGIITVAAVDESRQPLAGARLGPWIDVAAPGQDIPVMTADGQAALFSKSSAAAAVVSGVVALVLAAQDASKRRALGRRMEALMRETATRLPSAPANSTGHGLLNPAGLLQAAATL